MFDSDDCPADQTGTTLTSFISIAGSEDTRFQLEKKPCLSSATALQCIAGQSLHGMIQ
jgi:hypothetical protein